MIMEIACTCCTPRWHLKISADHTKNSSLQAIQTIDMHLRPRADIQHNDNQNRS